MRADDGGGSDSGGGPPGADYRDEDPNGPSPDYFENLPLRKDAPRPATILRCADELEARGGEVLELFREVASGPERVVFPIHLFHAGREFFVEVETGRWEEPVVQAVLRRAAVLRSSGSARAGLKVLSAYPVPEEVLFLSGLSPAALLQLDLTQASDDLPPGEAAGAFVRSAGRRWGTRLDYSTQYLPLVEELLLAAFELDERGAKPPVLEGLVRGLGGYLGETLRREASLPAGWEPSAGWGEGFVLALGDLLLDPVGKARAFLQNGTEDSISFYARYVLEEAGRS